MAAPGRLPVSGEEVRKVATNTGKGHRVGAVRQRSQSYNPRTQSWTKRGPGGAFMDGKSDSAPFKGVRKEK